MAKLRIREGHGIVPNSLLNSEKVSLKAQGLFAYIQSRPDGRDFSAERIALSHLDGIHAVKSTLRELEKLKYLVRKKYQLENGRRDWEYVLYNKPSVDYPPTVKPLVVYPPTEEPPVENLPIKETRDSKQDIIKKNKTISKDIEEQSSLKKDLEDFIPGDTEILQDPPPTPSQKFGDPKVNECLDMIKHYNEGVLNGSEGKQRLFAKHLIKKFSKMPKVLSGEMTWQDALSNILLRVSNNEYHKAKLGGPQDIFDNLGSLVQIAKETKIPEIGKRKVQKYIPQEKVKPLTPEEKKNRKQMLVSTQGMLKAIPTVEIKINPNHPSQK